VGEDIDEGPHGVVGQIARQSKVVAAIGAGRSGHHDLAIGLNSQGGGRVLATIVEAGGHLAAAAGALVEATRPQRPRGYGWRCERGGWYRPPPGW
jgi:hypothetical protein